MPTYQYQCTECGAALEVIQSFTDDNLTECPECAGRLRKVFNPVGVVFKGSGFYRTDSRSASTTSDATKQSEPSTNGSSQSDASAKEPTKKGSSSATTPASTGG